MSSSSSSAAVLACQDAFSSLLMDSPSSSETNSVSAHNVESTHSRQGPAHPSSSLPFYDTDRNSPHHSTRYPPSTSTGAAAARARAQQRGVSSSRREEYPDAISPSSSMSPARGESSSSKPPPSSNQDTRPSDSTRPHSQRPPVRHATTAPVQSSFPRQSFPPPHSFYPPHSNPAESYSSPAPYPPPPPSLSHSHSHGPPASGYLGQYMSSQPPHSLPMQPSMGYYSQPFALPGIHAHDPSAIPHPFPPLTRGYTFAGPSDSDHDSRNPSFPSTRPPQPPPPPAQSMGQQHAFPPLHFPHAPSPTHYAYPAPTIYSYAPNPYPPPPPSFYSQHSPASPEDASKGGTWYYVPPSRGTQYDASAYPGLYAVQGYQAVQMNRGGGGDFTDHQQQYPSASNSSSAPHQQHQQQQQSGQDSISIPSSQLQSQESSSSFPPPSPTALRHNPTYFTPISSSNVTSSSQSNRSPQRKPIADMPSPLRTSRKSYHPAPPANRSDWVMWVGNVPSDATHDEVWRFFNQSQSHPPPHSDGISKALPLPLPSSRLVHSSSSGSSPSPASAPTPANEEWGGVSSVFLISRSNCAFINFETQSHLENAISHFNGKPLRPHDHKCPKLVCRVRRKEDDLEAGVGAQRHRGLHTRWVSEQLELERKKREEDNPGFFVDAPPTSPSTYLAASSSSSDPSPPIHGLSSSHTDEPQTPLTPLRDLALSPDGTKSKTRTGSQGARSFSSTNSSLLREYFPKRYFILKSLSPFDLDFSLKRGVWSTQPHNEGILDQAYRTSKDVYLIFSANKSGEFFGYARMAGPVFPRKPEEQGSSAEGSSPSQSIGSPKQRDEGGGGGGARRGRFLTPSESQPLFDSPMPTPAHNPQLAIDVRGSQEAPAQKVLTAPAEPHQPHRRLSRPELTRAVGTYPEQGDLRYAVVPTSLDSLRTHAPVKGVMPDGRVILEKPAPRPYDKMAHSTSGVINKLGDVSYVRVDTYGGGIAEDIHGVEKAYYEEQEQERQGGAEDKLFDSVDKGREFKIEWIRTERLPFTRTKHLRNPWNHGREVKVSRDGTEIEPKVGQELLDEWDRPAPPPAAVVEPASTTNSPPTSPVRSRTARAAGGAGAGAATGGIQSLSSSNPAHLQTNRQNRPRPMPERH